MFAELIISLHNITYLGFDSGIACPGILGTALPASIVESCHMQKKHQCYAL